MKNEEKKRHSEKLFYNPNWEPPKIIYGRNLISEATETDEKYVIVTMEIPWNLVKNGVSKKPVKVVYVPDMQLCTLKNIEEMVPDDIEMVMGLGGGSSHDCAKYVALRKNARLVQFPTIFGGDASITTAIGIREGARVRYIGHVITDVVYIDYDILRKAPPILIRYGSADILSSYTALLDWKLASDRGKDKYNQEIAGYAKKRLLGKLKDMSLEIKNITEDGIKTIVELYLEYHKISHNIASDRAQEGSEHFFAYNAEFVTKRTFVHGALLSLGIWIIAGFFYNLRDDIESLLNSLGLEYNLKSAGLTNEEFIKTLKTLNDFTREGDYYYSIVNEVELDDKKLSKILNGLGIR